jgi:hypothetical protein
VAREAAALDLLMAWDALAFVASGRLPVRGAQGSEAVREALALLEDMARPSLDPTRTEHAVAELLAHERLEVGPGGGIQAGAAAAEVSACRTAMSRW